MKITTYNYTVFGQAYGEGQYNEGVYNDAATQTNTGQPNNGGSNNNGGDLANTGVDIFVPIVVGVVAIVASVALTLRKRKNKA